MWDEGVIGHVVDLRRFKSAVSQHFEHVVQNVPSAVAGVHGPRKFGILDSVEDTNIPDNGGRCEQCATTAREIYIYVQFAQRSW
jgi:malate/lactate dehydrogenase